jgi:hypothetical protein
MVNLKIDSQHSSGKEYDVTICCEEEDLKEEGVLFLFLFIELAAITVSRRW